jgi:hypothetical protein
MKKLFYVAVVAVVLFAAKSCKEPEPDPIVPPPPPQEDSSGKCTIIFKNLDTRDIDQYDVKIDNATVIFRIRGGEVRVIDTVQAGTRTLYAEQQTGHVPPNPAKTKRETVKILTDSVYTFEFP